MAVSPSGWSSRTNDQARIVTGPVSIPLTGFSVRLWVNVDQRTVIGAGRDTSPHRMLGRVAREPYDCTHPFCVTAKPSRFSAKYCTMSLRSGSPCTSTSSPMRSCSSTTSRISCWRKPSYSAWSISPFANRARSLRIAPVCGNEPIVVVGSGGRPNACVLRGPPGLVVAALERRRRRGRRHAREPRRRGRRLRPGGPSERRMRHPVPSGWRPCRRAGREPGSPPGRPSGRRTRASSSAARTARARRPRRGACGTGWWRSRPRRSARPTSAPPACRTRRRGRRARCCGRR